MCSHHKKQVLHQSLSPLLQLSVEVDVEFLTEDLIFFFLFPFFLPPIAEERLDGCSAQC